MANGANNLYLQTGKWKKAANAVARELATALYYMMLTGQEFSYKNYSLMKDISVFDIPVTELPSLNPDFKRYIHILQNSGIHTTSEMAAAYFSCRLGSVKGLGKKFFGLIKDFLTIRKNTKQPITKCVKEKYKMNRNTNANRISVLYVGGDVIDRTRQYIPKDNPTTEIVTYTIQDNNDRKFYVDDYAPDGYYDIGEQVFLPVYIKPYQKHNKELAYILCIQKKPSPRGEHF